MEKVLGVCKKNVKGAILERGLERFTKLSLFFPVIKDEILNYNWLLTDIDADYYSDSLKNNHYELISGEKFMQLIEGDQFTFVWGVLCYSKANIYRKNYRGANTICKWV